MDKPELNPCPFCGGKPQLCPLSNSSSHFGVGFAFEIACTSCKIKLPNRFEILLHLKENGELEITKDDRERAAEAWNRRTEQTGEWLEDEYGYCRCSRCGYEHDDPETTTPYCPECGAKMNGLTEVTED